MRDEMTPLERLQRGYGREEFVKLCFEELNVSQQCTTGAGGRFIPEYASGPSGGFYANELGFGWWNDEPDVLETTRTLPFSNAERKRVLKTTHENLQKELVADAKSKNARPVLEPFPEEEGCTGCASCVRDARIAPKPRVIKLAGKLTDWLPWDPNFQGRRVAKYQARQLRAPAELEHRRLVRRLTAGTRDLRIIVENEIRAENGLPALPIPSRRRSKSARRAMQARRGSEETTVRAAARRALGISSTTRR